MSVAIVRYNAGNVRSVSIALTRLGIQHAITDNPDEIVSASHVILPGVGEASAARSVLEDRVPQAVFIPKAFRRYLLRRLVGQAVRWADVVHWHYGCESKRMMLSSQSPSAAPA